MKAKLVILSGLLTLALIIPLGGQDTLINTGRPDMKKPETASKMGKPAVDTSMERLHVRVWLVTQMVNQKTINEMKPMGMPMQDSGISKRESRKGLTRDGMRMDPGTKKIMMAGTHNITLDVTDALSGKSITGVSAEVQLQSPSGKTSAIPLTPMMSRYGSGLTLDEKGDYLFSVNINAGGIAKTTQFECMVD